MIFFSWLLVTQNVYFVLRQGAGNRNPVILVARCYLVLRQGFGNQNSVVLASRLLLGPVLSSYIDTLFSSGSRLRNIRSVGIVVNALAYKLRLPTKPFVNYGEKSASKELIPVFVCVCDNSYGKVVIKENLYQWLCYLIKSVIVVVGLIITYHIVIKIVVKRDLKLKKG
jgi:hypothetical protein